MVIFNKLNPKLTRVKKGVDLAATFNTSIDGHIHDTTVTIMKFDCYREISLKQATRTFRKGKSVPRAFHISYKSSIDKVAMSELISFEETRQSIPHYLTETTGLHLRKRRAFHQLRTWVTAAKAQLDEHDPNRYGWTLEKNKFVHRFLGF